MKRGAAIAVGQVDVYAGMFEQSLDGRQAASRGGELQRGLAFGILGVGINVGMAQQCFKRLRVRPGDGDVKGCGAIGVVNVYIALWMAFVFVNRQGAMVPEEIKEALNGLTKATNKIDVSLVCIIVTCTAIIFACTWTIQHLNVPLAHDGELRRCLRVSKWMLVTILLPELILAHAILELAMAVRCMDLMQAALRDDRRQGEIDVKYPSWLTDLRNWSTRCRTMCATPGLTSLHDGPGDEEKQSQPLESSSRQTTQISNLVLSLSVRRIQGLPISQLEVLILAFSVCGVATYAVYWYKPKDVSVALAFQTLKSFDSFLRVLIYDLGQKDYSEHRVPNDNIPAHDMGFTHEEAIVWHVCTILTILIPPLGLLGIPLSQATWRHGNPRDFLYATAQVLRKLSCRLKEADEKREVAIARRALGGGYHWSVDTENRYARGLYRDLLWPDNSAFKYGPALRQKMLDFIDKKEPFQHRPDLDCHGTTRCIYASSFSSWMGRGPRRCLPTAFKSAFLYVAMGSYCAARPLLVAVGLSSLRAMPQGVYNATWADYMPAI
ncbi:hypothetical protein N657DRAFT_631122 [Parathielavia appendiculata]|uniref:Uncharacterized protein n=1 Tax=Parathielavia appendiculata TaxID=2587402 RepID=A0AAN6Z7M3_9PEZI|nr:hypothetical protein N657DRAFT_631122 [Parathielavia appendiculata]